VNHIFKVLWSFAVHEIVGTLLFLIIYAPAVGLYFLVHFLDDWIGHPGGSRFLLLAIEGAEYSLLVVDTVLFASFLLKTAYRTWKEL
jgi:hypothetical protein